MLHVTPAIVSFWLREGRLQRVDGEIKVCDGWQLVETVRVCSSLVANVETHTGDTLAEFCRNNRLDYRTAMNWKERGVVVYDRVIGWTLKSGYGLKACFTMKRK